MKKIIVLCFLLISTFINAQEELMIDENTPIVDEKGQQTSFSSVLPKLDSGEYTLEPVINNDGTLKHAKLRKLSKEEQQEMEAFLAEMEANDRKYIGQDVPDFKVTDINGNSYTKADLKGKVVVINFWFIQCKPCTMEMPELNKLVAKYHQNKDVIFLAPTFNQKDKILKFLKKKSFNYALIAEAEKTIKDFNINSYPTNIIMNKEGKYSMYMTGGMDHIDEMMTPHIEQALQ